ncbi:MAG TPA: hypothetical protein VF702_08625 [Allosphingosinicella sp.]
MRTWLLRFLIGASFASGGAIANLPVEGDGREESSVLRSIEARPLTTLGADALRFSTEPQLGGKAIVVEIARSAEGSHRVRVRRFHGHFRSGWAADGEWNFLLSDRRYRAFVARVDRLLAQPDPRPDCRGASQEECMYVCTDGPGILVERASGGRTVWRRGSCGPRHPNDLIEKAVRRLLRRNLGRRVYSGS